MRRMRKFFCFLLSMIMILSMSVTAFAGVVLPEDDSTVGTLTIFASNDGGSSSLNVSGHAFITFKNYSSSSVRVGGLNVRSRQEITIGTWGNKSQHQGIWYNLESYFANNNNAYSNRVSLSILVTRDDVDIVNSIISNNDKWSLTNNCSSFAIKVWNSVSSETLSAGSPNTPTSLMSSIKSKSGYKTGQSISSSTPIGYVSNGSFETVTMTSAANLSPNNETTIMNTTTDKIEFITSINMNPYSYTSE